MIQKKASDAGVEGLDNLHSLLFTIVPVANLPAPTLQPYFDALQLTPGATPKEIKMAWRNLSFSFHPDRPNGDATRFREIDEAYKMLKGETCQPDAADLLGAKIFRDQSKTLTMPLNMGLFEGEHEAVGYTYIQVLQLLDTDGYPYCEMFGKSPVFHHRDGDQWIAKKVLAVAKYRFNPTVREAGLPFGAPLSLNEIKKFQKTAFEPDGFVTWLMHYDPDSTHADESIRINSHGWKALCAIYGHLTSTSVFTFYLNGFYRASQNDHKRPAPGELKPLTQRDFKKYKKQRIADGQVWLHPSAQGLTFDNAINMLNTMANYMDGEGPSSSIH